MATILITGANGQLGNEMQLVAKGDRKNSYIFTDVNELDITNVDAIRQFANGNNINFIVNCAAYTAVDNAEDNYDICYKINCTAVENLAVVAKEIGAKVIHISTDYVYGGDSKTPYSETDETIPCSVYGKTKLLGEKALQNILPETSIIIRTAWLYSTFGKNFVKTMIELGKQCDTLSVVCDQRGTPTYARDLANAIHTITEHPCFVAGIYNYTNEGECSWYDFACEIHKLANVECNVKPIPTSEYPTKATRPAYSVLNKTKIKEIYGVSVPQWEESLKECIYNLNNKQ